MNCGRVRTVRRQVSLCVNTQLKCPVRDHSRHFGWPGEVWRTEGEILVSCSSNQVLLGLVRKSSKSPLE